MYIYKYNHAIPKAIKYMVFRQKKPYCFFSGFTSSTLPGDSFWLMVGLTSRVYIEPLVLIPCLNTKVKLTVFGVSWVLSSPNSFSRLPSTADFLKNNNNPLIRHRVLEFHL